MSQIYSNKSPYPAIGAVDLCEGCPVTVVNEAQKWNWTAQDDLWTLAINGWYAVPNEQNSSVAVSQESSQGWNIAWSNDGSLRFNASLPGQDQYWTITGTGEETWVQFLPDGSDKPFWYQEFITPSPTNE